MADTTVELVRTCFAPNEKLLADCEKKIEIFQIVDAAKRLEAGYSCYVTVSDEASPLLAFTAHCKGTPRSK